MAPDGDAVSRARAFALARFILGAALLLFLLRKVDARDISRTIANADGGHLTLALAASAMASIFEIAKYRAACHFRITYRGSAVLVFIGIFLSNFLPSSIGGDGYKIWAMRRRDISPAAALAYVISDRITGMLSLILLGGIGYLAAPDTMIGWIRLQPATDWIPATVMVVAACVFIIVMMSLSLRSFRVRICDAVRKLAPTVKAYASGPVLPTLAHAVLFQLCRAAALWEICRATGFTVAMTSVLQILLLVALVSMIPITLGGLGVREGASAFLLRLCGMSAEAAFAATLISLVVLWLKSLIGAALFLSVDRAKIEPL